MIVKLASRYLINKYLEANFVQELMNFPMNKIRNETL
jgi:hypothetical protein